MIVHTNHQLQPFTIMLPVTSNNHVNNVNDGQMGAGKMIVDGHS